MRLADELDTFDRAAHIILDEAVSLARAGKCAEANKALATLAGCVSSIVYLVAAAKVDDAR